MEEDWNISSYRNKFEPDEQWEMRKKFMEVNKHSFSEDRVVCLAQVLVNMEFLGTKYPFETMTTVNELSQDIIEEFRERQKNRLQRTFVGGTDAASAKIKGTRTTSRPTQKSEIEKKIAESNANYFLSAILSSSSKSVVKEETTLNQERNSKCNPSLVPSTKNDCKPTSEIPSRKRKIKKKKASAVEETSTNNAASSKCQSEETLEPIRKKKKLKNKNVEIANPKLSNFVLIMLKKEKNNITRSASGDTSLKPNYRQIIENSARFSGVQLQIKNSFLGDQGKWESVLSLDGRRIASSLHENQKISQKNIAKLAFTVLEKTYYQIVVTDKKYVSVGHFMTQEEDARLTQVENTLSTMITKEVMEGKANKTSNNAFEILSKGENAVAQPVKATAAMKMMKMMGWSEGTGLGLKKQGIVEPIKSDVVVGRKGIGYDGPVSSETFAKLIRHYLVNYKKSASVHNIVFSKEFSTDERKLVHTVARGMGMLSSSIGKGPNRQLTVRRSPCKPRPLIELLNQLTKSKGLDPLFSRINLIPPTD